jgi:hypothetical protein
MLLFKDTFGALLLIAMNGFFLFLRINKCCDLCKGVLKNIINFCHTGFRGMSIPILSWYLGYQDVPKRVNGQFYILFSFASFSYYKFFNYRGHY